MREAVIEAGARYVAVDIQGERKQAQNNRRQTAIILECNGKVLANKIASEHTPLRQSN